MAKRIDSLIIPLAGEQVPANLRIGASQWMRLARKLGYDGAVIWYDPKTRRFYYWIPRPVPESKGYTVGEQLQVLIELRQAFDLPTHHLSSFGGAALLSDLIWAYWQTTKQPTPPNRQWVITDTPLLNLHRVILGDFRKKRLHVSSCHVASGITGVGCFPLGVEPRP